ncbi:hypothetical protein DM01DRAFT_305641 [Hesseltinella vesiculosa]|uniref:F-box domain-containing protein n=1 Tax=Hesseltinella vesiculosa TaxID=101127 RepID=A0A1X2GE67_9FUNG|nr:hypothetical protein DM01DRAFT_305641 [Hesseltinella vesiculosa]
MGLTENLPTEILNEIFSYFQDIQDFTTLNTLRQVCRQWQQVIDIPSRWQVIFMNRPLSVQQLKRYMHAHRPFIHRLTLHQVKDEMLRHVLTDYPALEYLCVTQWTTLTHHSFRLFKYGHIRQLVLVGGNKDPFLALDAPALVRLLEMCPLITCLDIQQCLMPIKSIQSVIKALQTNPIQSRIESLTLPIQYPCTHSERLLLGQYLPSLTYLHLLV